MVRHLNNETNSAREEAAADKLEKQQQFAEAKPSKPPKTKAKAATKSKPSKTAATLQHADGEQDQLDEAAVNSHKCDDCDRDFGSKRSLSQRLKFCKAKRARTDE